MVDLNNPAAWLDAWLRRLDNKPKGGLGLARLGSSLQANPRQSAACEAITERDWALE